MRRPRMPRWARSPTACAPCSANTARGEVNPLPYTPPRVFISYSHDTPAHESTVLALSDRLRSDGIDTILDQYETFPPQGWPLWTEQQVQTADFVLVVCTQTYRRRADSEEEP